MSNPERCWAIATAPNKRTGRRYVFEDTIRTTRRGAIDAYEATLPATGGYVEDRKRYGIGPVRVLVQIEDQP